MTTEEKLNAIVAKCRAFLEIAAWPDELLEIPARRCGE